MKLVIFFLIIMLCTISINALSCNIGEVSKNVIVGNQITSDTIICSNDGNTTVTLYKFGDFYSLSPNTPIPFSSNTSQSIVINYLQNNLGFYSGFLFSSDGTNINIKLNITQNANKEGVIVFPTAKVINLQQNQEKSQNLQIIVPLSYPRSITIQSVTMNPEISLLNFDDLNLGQISPGMTLNIPFKVNSKDAQVGTYQTELRILATDSNGQVILSPSNIQIVVSASINPISNDTFAQRPSCSLSNTVFSMNQTYTLTCNNAVSNIEISPQYNDFIEGVKADYSAGIYTYNFKATKVGNSKFVATFTYKNSPIFTPFESDFKVTPSGSSNLGGIDLDLQFFQNGLMRAKDNLNLGNTLIVVVDNKTGNLVEDYKIYLNGQYTLNNTINVELDKTYNLRVTSEGYNDLVLNNLTPSILPLSVTFNPDKSVYEVGDLIYLNSSVVNYSMSVNDVLSYSPYTVSTSGNLNFKFYKEGYLSSNKTIFVNTPVSLGQCSLVQTEWKKGKDIVCDLTKDANWSVLINNLPINQGNGNKVNFKITDAGNLAIMANNKQIGYQVIEDSSLIKWVTQNWIIVTIGAVILLLIVFFIFRGKSSSDNITPYS